MENIALPAIQIVYALAECLLYAIVVHMTMGKTLHGKTKLRFWSTLVLTTILYFIVNTQISNIILRSILLTALLSVVVSALYGISFKISAFYTISSFYIFLLSEQLVGCIYTGIVQITNLTMMSTGDKIVPITISIVGQNPGNLILLCVLGTIVRILLTVGLIYFFGKNQLSNPTGYWVTIDFLVFAAYGIVMIFYSITDAIQTVVSSFYIALIEVLLLGISAAAVRVFYSLGEKNYQERTEVEQIRHLLENDQHIQEMAALYNEMNRAGHDQENMAATVIAALTAMRTEINDPQRVEMRINKALDEMGGMADQAKSLQTPEWTKITDIDRSISTLQLSARVTDLDIIVKANPGHFQEMNIKTTDIQSILSNLVHNAMDASRHVKGGATPILLNITQGAGILRIEVINEFSNTLLRSGKNSFVTTKKGEGHGSGLTFVERTCAKYGGDFKTLPADNLFIAQVSLPFEKPA